MFKRNEKYYALLVPYLEGGLDDVRAADLRARLAEDPALAAEAERLRLTLSSLREMSRRSPAGENVAVPADLWPRLRDRLPPPSAPRRAAPAGWLAAVGAAAAVAFAALWLPAGPRTEPTQVVQSPRPKAAAKGQERMAYATKPEPLSLSAPALPTPLPPTPVVAVPPTPAAMPGSSGKSVAPKPVAGPPTLSRHDPFAVASTGAAKVGPRPATPLVVPAPPASSAPVAAVIPVGPTKKPTPTLMASSGGPVANGDRLAGARKMAPPQATASATLDLLTLPSVPDLLPPAPTPLPASSLANSATGGINQQVQKGVTDSSTGAQGQVKDNLGGNFQARNFAAGQSQAFGLNPQQGLNAYRNQQQTQQTRQQKLTQKKTLPGAIHQSGGLLLGQSLDDWQSSLAQALQPPLLGQDAGAQQANQALMSARESGNLDALRERLEVRRAQSPRDLGTARMLAAVYDFAFSTEAALHERRRLVMLDGATGEDWYALAEAEGHTGNGQAARAAYRRALDAPGPLSGFHALLAKGRG